jgi:GNAT superfamily N-acetyltransferase
MGFNPSVPPAQNRAMSHIDPSGLVIRPLHDLRHLAPLCAAWSYSEWGCLEDGGRQLHEIVEEYERRAGNPEALPQTWVCLAGGRPAGMISLKQRDHMVEPSVTPWLASLFVHPAFRRRGIARKLCRMTIGEARRRGFTRLYLYTEADPGLYREFGWRPIGILPDPSRLSRRGCVLMELRI